VLVAVFALGEERARAVRPDTDAQPSKREAVRAWAARSWCVLMLTLPLLRRDDRLAVGVADALDGLREPCGALRVHLAPAHSPSTDAALSSKSVPALM